MCSHRDNLIEHFNEYDLHLKILKHKKNTFDICFVSCDKNSILTWESVGSKRLFVSPLLMLLIISMWMLLKLLPGNKGTLFHPNHSTV